MSYPSPSNLVNSFYDQGLQLEQKYQNIFSTGKDLNPQHGSWESCILTFVAHPLWTQLKYKYTLKVHWRIRLHVGEDWPPALLWLERILSCWGFSEVGLYPSTTSINVGLFTLPSAESVQRTELCLYMNAHFKNIWMAFLLYFLHQVLYPQAGSSVQWCHSCSMSLLYQSLPFDFLPSILALMKLL